MICTRHLKFIVGTLNPRVQNITLTFTNLICRGNEKCINTVIVDNYKNQKENVKIIIKVKERKKKRMGKGV